MLVDYESAALPAGPKCCYALKMLPCLLVPNCCYALKMLPCLLVVILVLCDCQPVQQLAHRLYVAQLLTAVAAAEGGHAQDGLKAVLRIRHTFSREPSRYHRF